MKKKSSGAARKPAAADRALARELSHYLVGQLRQMNASSNVVPSGSRSETRWRGASQSLRSMATATNRLGSGRSDTTKAERERMAARGYDAYRNHLLARSIITRYRTNVVGTGLQLFPDVNAEVLGITEDQADELNEQILSEWILYYNNPLEVDLEGCLDGAGLQGLALITALIAGDCWALTPYEENPGTNYGLKVQLIDPARVTNPNLGPDTETLLDGVELSRSGRPLAIHVRRRHPDDRLLSSTIDGWDRRPIFSDTGVRRIFQIWNDKDRIGVTRGVSMLAPILEPLEQITQLTRAELMAAVIAALFTVFIKKETELVDDKGNPLPAIQGQTVKGNASDIALGNGAIIDLAPGEDIVQANPMRPNSKYDPFFLALATQIGAAVELPVDEVLLRYQSSYSAARAAMLQAWRSYVQRRWWLVQQFCAPHYALWFDEAVARGRLPLVTQYADPKRRAAYLQALWIGPSRGAMQENDEIQAAKARIDAGLSNETIETAQIMGENWLTIYRQRRRELKRRKEDGTELGPAPGQGAAPGAGPPGGKPAKPGEKPAGDDPDRPADPDKPAPDDDVDDPENPEVRKAA